MIVGVGEKERRGAEEAGDTRRGGGGIGDASETEHQERGDPTVITSANCTAFKLDSIQSYLNKLTVIVCRR